MKKKLRRHTGMVCILIKEQKSSSRNHETHSITKERKKDNFKRKQRKK